MVAADLQLPNLPFRRGDRDPNSNSSCHFRDKKKILGPELSARNINKIFAMTSPWKKESERRQVTQN